MSNNGSKLKRLWRKYINSFNALTVTLLFIVAGFILYIYFFYPEHEDDLKFVTTIMIAFSGVFSAIYVGKGLSNRLHFDRIKNSLKFSSFVTSHEYNELKDRCKQQYHRHEHSPRELVANIKQDEELFYKLISLLNKFENMSIAIQKGYVDEHSLYWSLDLVVRFYIENFRSYIDEVREENTEYYIELLKLNDAWSDRRYLSSGKPVD